MDFPEKCWAFPGNPMETQWKPNGNPMETQWKPNGNPMETHGRHQASLAATEADGRTHRSTKLPKSELAGRVVSNETKQRIRSQNKPSEENRIYRITEIIKQIKTNQNKSKKKIEPRSPSCSTLTHLGIQPTCGCRP